MSLVRPFWLGKRRHPGITPSRSQRGWVLPVANWDYFGSGGDAACKWPEYMRPCLGRTADRRPASGIGSIAVPGGSDALASGSPELDDIGALTNDPGRDNTGRDLKPARREQGYAQEPNRRRAARTRARLSTLGEKRSGATRGDLPIDKESRNSMVMAGAKRASDPRPSAPIPRTRRCLKCGADFPSEWAGQRVCAKCKKKVGWRSGTSLRTY